MNVVTTPCGSRCIFTPTSASRQMTWLLLREEKVRRLPRKVKGSWLRSDDWDSHLLDILTKNPLPRISRRSELWAKFVTSVYASLQLFFTPYTRSPLFPPVFFSSEYFPQTFFLLINLLPRSSFSVSVPFRRHTSEFNVLLRFNIKTSCHLSMREE